MAEAPVPPTLPEVSLRVQCGWIIIAAVAPSCHKYNYNHVTEEGTTTTLEPSEGLLGPFPPSHRTGTFGRQQQQQQQQQQQDNATKRCSCLSG